MGSRVRLLSQRKKETKWVWLLNVEINPATLRILEMLTVIPVKQVQNLVKEESLQKVIIWEWGLIVMQNNQSYQVLEHFQVFQMQSMTQVSILITFIK